MQLLIGASPGWAVLLLIYYSLVLATGYAFFLYLFAYRQMKRSKVIGSIAFMMFAFVVESMYFLLLSYSLTQAPALAGILYNSYFWAIPKLLVLSSIIYFIYASLCPSEEYGVKGLGKICKESKEV